MTDLRSAALAAASAVAVAVALLVPGIGAGSAAATPASYPSCGKYWNRNQPVSALERRVNACIVDAALSGRRARAVAARSTIEGDRIVNYLFVRGKGNVLVVVDSRGDRFGAAAWTRFRCATLELSASMLVWERCVSAGIGKPLWLVPARFGS